MDRTIPADPVMRSTVVEGREEAALVASLRRGDPEALREAYASYGVAVYRIALRLTGSTADADDVLQDVFVGLPEALRGYEVRVSFVGWLRRVAARTALMRMRRRERRREEHLTPEHEPPARSSDDLDRLALERAIAALPASLRSVFVLKEIEGYPHAHIAELLGIGIGASEVRLHRAKQQLRGILRSR